MLFHIPSGSPAQTYFYFSITSRAWKMRNAFVVLVSLCIGVVSGFIVPSSVPEHSTVKNSIPYTVTSRDVKLKSTTSTKYAILPKSRNNIDEKDLYEHATEKKNNQSERAFVYINQKYNKNPFRSKLMKMLPIDRFDFPYAVATGVTAAAATALTSGMQTPCPSAFDSAPNFNSKFQEFNSGDNTQRLEMSSYFSAPNIFRCNFNDESKKNEIPKVVQVPASQRVDERRDYFELLKPPILRPGNHKVNYDKIKKIGLSSLSPTSIPYEDNNINKYSLKNQYVPQANVATVPGQNEIRRNYGFNGAFIRRPAYQPKEIANRVEDANFEDDFINEDVYRKNFENNQEEDKLLAKYLKDTLEEVPLINVHDKVHGNLPDCIHDCVLEPRKNLPKNNGILIKPDCQCGKTPSVKQADPFVSKDRSLREESDRNVTLPKSSEVLFYEEVLSDDSNMIKQDDDVIRPPNRINHTVFH